MGFWMKVWRPGKVLEAALFGRVMLIFSVFVGTWVAGERVRPFHEPGRLRVKDGGGVQRCC
jgi:carbon starvation protein CstA